MMYNPTQEEIRAACLNIQANWSAVEEFHRRVIKGKSQWGREYRMLGVDKSVAKVLTEGEIESENHSY